MSWRIGGRRGIRNREEGRAGGVVSKMVESGRNRRKLKGFKGGSQEKRGRLGPPCPPTIQELYI